MSSRRRGGSWTRGQMIGRGTFGAVSLARGNSNGQFFAVKSVDLNSSPNWSIAALENEIRILRSLDSPYIVSYLGDDTTGTFRNLHLEYMPGGAATSAAAETEVRDRGRCLARALDYLHAVAGVVHGDVKGGNLLLGSDPGAAKLSDFGSAAGVGEDRVRGPRGTPLWMAPEVARGEDPTPASDVWSMGCTVIEMATGDRPWPDSDHAGAMIRIGFGSEVPKFPPNLSKSGRDFLHKCLKRNAGDRWTAGELLRHPFLAVGDGIAAAPSPRSVLNWGSGLESDDSDSDEVDSDREMDSGRGRIRELGSEGGIVRWERDGWEAVRWADESGSGSGSGEEGTGRGYLECCGDNRGDDDVGVRRESVATIGAGMTCCGCCNSGLGCHKGVAVREGLFFHWHEMSDVYS